MQMTSPFNEKGEQFAFDSTTLKLAETCMRKYKYKIIDRWQPYNKSVHLLFGGLYATALEHYAKYMAQGQSSNDALCAVVHEALISTWEYKRDEAGNIVTNADGTRIGAPWISADSNKTRESLIRSIVWYVDQFEDESIKTIQLSNGVPAVEYSFKLPVDNGVVFCGHIDRLVTYGDDPYVMDQKTTGSTITARFFDQFNPDMQMSMYTFAGNVIYNMPVKGVIIDAAQIAVGFTRFQRGFTHRSAEDLDEWFNDTMVLIEDIQRANRTGNYPKRSTSCGNFGGCEFRHICSRSPAVRDNFLKGDFYVGEQWNPLEPR